jgi:hypothetical protein
MLKNTDDIEDSFILVESSDDEQTQRFIHSVECFGNVVEWVEADFTLKDNGTWLMSKHEMELYLKVKGSFLMTVVNKHAISRAVDIAGGQSAKALFKMYSIKA